MSEFHGPIAANNRERHGVFFTPVKLFRISTRANTLQVPAEGPTEIIISDGDLRSLWMHLGKGPGQPGTLNKVFRLADGREIIPGNYMVRTPDSFMGFEDDARGNNILIRLYKEAEARRARMTVRRQKTPGEQAIIWGEGFDLLSHWLSTPEMAAHVGILSGAAYAKETWMDFFAFLQRKKLGGQPLVRNLPNPDRIFSLGSRQFDELDLQGRLPVREEKIISDYLRQLRRVSLTEADLQDNLEADGQAKLHTFVLMVSEPVTAERIWEVLRSFAQGGYAPVKIVFINVGDEKYVQASGRPRVVVIRRSGAWREPTESEWNRLFPQSAQRLNQTESGISSCAGKLKLLASSSQKPQSGESGL